ncbi:5-hydroxyisourate hydrolase-like [Elgaria multicarinata webbii]|uniref:5-hydroxyisourate hydrolase-like n=1 Tax=Elgaria multicarinata webbii TaxID=159646 RepID=UPI002FCCE347
MPSSEESRRRERPGAGVGSSLLAALGTPLPVAFFLGTWVSFRTKRCCAQQPQVTNCRTGADKGNEGFCRKGTLDTCREQVAGCYGAKQFSLSLHALDLLTGLPATGLDLRLAQFQQPRKIWKEIMRSTTNKEGRLDKRIPALGRLTAGTYKLRFDTGKYWQQQGRTSFYPYVDVVFTVTGAESKVHIPLLTSPYSYTTYRGN